MLKAFFTPELIEAGCDEAGRGCLAGPVFAAAVILPKDFEHPELNDSKQVDEKMRYELRDYIKQHAKAWAVGIVDNREIDTINILNASFLAMHKAVDQLIIRPQQLLVDGNRFKKYPGIPHECIIKGDEQYLSIAAASILAKTFRDDFMRNMHMRYPNYGWDTNKGYATEFHRDAIRKHGITDLHRLSFRLQPDQLELDM